MAEIVFSVQNIESEYPGQMYPPHNDPLTTVINTNELVYSGVGIIETHLDAPAWSWTFSGNRLVEGTNIDISQEGDDLHVSYTDNIGIFPKIVHIEYLDPDYNVHTVNDVANLPSPENSPYITNMVQQENYYKDTQYVIETISVSIVGTQGGEPATDSGVFNVSIFINFQSQKDVVRQLLDERGV